MTSAEVANVGFLVAIKNIARKCQLNLTNQFYAITTVLLIRKFSQNWSLIHYFGSQVTTSGRIQVFTSSSTEILQNWLHCPIVIFYRWQHPKGIYIYISINVPTLMPPHRLRCSTIIIYTKKFNRAPIFTSQLTLFLLPIGYAIFTLRAVTIRRPGVFTRVP